MRSKWDEPFPALTVHFFKRFFDTDAEHDESTPRTRLIQLLASIVVAGPVLTYFLMSSPPLPIERFEDPSDMLWLPVGYRYMFVCYAMAVMGLVMAYKWDYLFPDRRDYLILTCLPIPLKRFFLAKVAAVGAFLLLFAVATNAFSILAVLAIDPNAVVGHIVAVLAASIFVALAAAAVQGMLVSVLPLGAFRRLSPSIQTVSIAALLTMLLILPLLRASVRPLARIDSPLLDYFPPVWFLGIYESLNLSGSIVPNARAWASSGVAATALAAAAFFLSYYVGYRRHARKVLETAESAVFEPPWTEGVASRAANRWLLVNCFQRAVFFFTARISERSPKHRMIASFYAGAGIALVLSSLFVIDQTRAFPFSVSTMGLLQAPLILSFLLIAGWRAAFKVPSDLQANWVFRLADRQAAAAFRKGLRKWLVVSRIVPLYLLLAPVEFALFDRRTALSHLAFDFVTTVFLMEAFLIRYNRVPFTSALMRSKLQLGVTAVAYLYAFTTYVSIMGRLKFFVSSDPQRLIPFLAVSAMVFGALLICRSLLNLDSTRIEYDDIDGPFQRLDLS